MNQRKKQVAVVGTGYWGKNLVRNFKKLGALHSICDADVTRAEQLAEEHDVPVGVDFRSVLDDPNVDAVALATPAEQHGAMVIDALQSGKDVFVEKPLALREEEAKAIVQLAERTGRIVMVGHLLWYHPCVRKLKELVANGDVGKVSYIYSNRLNMGKLRREENVLWSFAPHDVSVILGLVGEMPESVYCKGSNYLHNEIADTTVSLLTFASGLKAHIFVSWLHPFKEQKLIVVGSKQMIVFDDVADWDQKLQLYPHSVEWSEHGPVAQKAEVTYINVDPSEPLNEECAHFLECIESRQEPRTGGEEGFRVLKVLNACQRSLEQGSEQGLDVSHAAATVHPTAIVDDGVFIGAGTKIWHFSHVLKGSTIGASCNIGQNVVVGPDVNIGAGCRIQNNVSVYDGVTLEEDVFCGPSMVFTNIINPRSHTSRKDEFRQTLVKRGASIGANATVICGNTLGKSSFVAAGAVVTKNVPDHALVAGNPARQIGWMCECGEKLDDELKCTACKRRYAKSDAGLEPVQ